MADATQTAASFGYSLAFFRHNPELSSLLDRATAENFTSERFVAELHNTGWFQQTSESRRKYEALYLTDPSTLQDLRYQMQARLFRTFSQVGAIIPEAELRPLTDQAIAMGADDNVIMEMAKARLQMEGGHYKGGQASAFETQARQIVSDYGLQMDDGTMGWYIRNAIGGDANMDALKRWATETAVSKYPALKQRIEAGQTVRQIAEPYIQSQAKILEQAPTAINIDDPLIQQALATKDKNGQPATKTVWQFENDLRADPRWLATQNAQDTTMKTAKAVLTDFGLVS